MCVKVTLEKQIFNTLELTFYFYCYIDNNWETEGLETTYDTHFIVCSSKHLSTFSVLLDPTNLLYPNDLRRHNLQEQFILTIISVTGSLITIPCLLLIIVIYYHK